MIIIINFGSQTTDLIGRRIRDFGIGLEIVEPTIALARIKKLKPSGIILSGGPASVYEKNSLQLRIYKKNIFFQNSILKYL